MTMIKIAARTVHCPLTDLEDFPSTFIVHKSRAPFRGFLNICSFSTLIGRRGRSRSRFQSPLRFHSLPALCKWSQSLSSQCSECLRRNLMAHENCTYPPMVVIYIFKVPSETCLSSNVPRLRGEEALCNGAMKSREEPVCIKPPDFNLAIDFDSILT